MTRRLQSLNLRQGHPPFLDLPWAHPLGAWSDHSPRLVDLPRGISRHEVLFLGYAEATYAFKVLPVDVAEREHDNLRRMEDRGLPVVVPVGLARVAVDGGAEEEGVLITRFLDGALPYRALFAQQGLERYRDRLLDAMAGLLVRLHLAGCYWGDCSLSNTLFRRDAGELQAILVDAETAEVHDDLSPGQREADLGIMEENVAGDLLDLAAQMETAPVDADDTGPSIRRRYDGLWGEISREVLIGPAEEFRIHERVRALNQLGFSVGGIELVACGEGSQLRLRTIVTDRDYHRHQLHSLAGVVANEHQASLLLEEVRQLRAVLSRELGRSVPLSMAAQRWLEQRYQPALRQLGPLVAPGTDVAELYCQVLEHKWFLSERARRDVGMERAVEDYRRRFGPEGPAAGAGNAAGSGSAAEAAPTEPGAGR